MMGVRNPPIDPGLLKAGLLVFGIFATILICVSVLKLLRQAYFGPEQGSQDVIDALRDAHEAGELDDEEFQRIAQNLSKPFPDTREIAASQDADSIDG